METIKEFATTYLTNAYVQALLVLIAAVILAKVTDVVITRFFRGLASRTATDLDDHILQHLHRPVFVTVVMVGAAIAVTLLKPPGQVAFVAHGVLKTVILVLWALAGVRIVGALLDGFATSEKIGWVDEQMLPLFKNLSTVVVLAVAVYAMLSIWKLDVAPWLASAGVVGLALGFAAKDTLANLFGGIFIFADTPYKVGDFIVLDSGERGQVTNIGLRSTRLLTRDDVEITIPNAAIANAKITNETGGPHPKRRVTVNVGVAYGSDVDLVGKVLVEAARSVAVVVDDPEPRVRFSAFGDSSLDFRLLAWIREPVERGLAIHELHTAVYKGLAAAKIEIPFPQRDVHMKASSTQ